MGTMTALRVPGPVVVDRDSARVAMMVAPLAVLPVAVIAGAVAELGRAVAISPLVVAVLVLGTFALGSRALHLDGLADTADGLTGSYDAERALEIMRRGNTGPAGAAALVLVLVLQVAALTPILARPWGPLVAVVLLGLARSSLLVTCAAGIPAARPGGLGASVAGVIPRPAGVVLGAVAAAIAAVVLPLSGRPWWQGVTAVVVAGAAVLALVLRCRRRFGGITGDVVGAGIEVAAAALLAVAGAG
ncbi:cobalamin-5'-phosphate synthase [Nakamurella panacisegetis]|uniref:Adenosylcobinamide-GDP ribazoletransferase n=2 Tax=Nakamurella panacisegetis TaxID=1090615 RepID=A0A1H0HYZ6_9ACTN|nr:cobalamin-5'-phosphate synthase [Nakamurella panacisegetis]